MRRLVSLSAMALALGLLAAGALRAADAQSGSITGKVVDANGNVVVGATIRAVAPIQKHEKKAAASDGKEEKEGKEGKEGKGPREGHKLAEATSASDGTFTLTGIPAGKVIVVAMKKDIGVARLKDGVDVKAGETVTLSAPLTLEKLAKPTDHGDKKEKKEKKD